MKYRYAAVIISGLTLLAVIVVYTIAWFRPGKFYNGLTFTAGSVDMEFSLYEGRDFNLDGTLDLYDNQPGEVASLTDTDSDLYVRYSDSEYTNFYEHKYRIITSETNNATATLTIDDFFPSQVYTYLINSVYNGTVRGVVSMNFNNAGSSTIPDTARLLAIRPLLQATQPDGSVTQTPLSQGDIYLINYQGNAQVPLANDVLFTKIENEQGITSTLSIVLEIRFPTKQELIGAAAQDTTGAAAAWLDSIDLNSYQGAEFILPDITIKVESK